MSTQFTIPFKIGLKPFRKCEECHKRKLTTSFYEIHDNGLNSYITAFICRKCIRGCR